MDIIMRLIMYLDVLYMILNNLGCTMLNIIFSVCNLEPQNV